MKLNKTHIVKLTLIAFLAVALIVPIMPAIAADVALQGQINSAIIEIEIDPGVIELDIDPTFGGATTASGDTQITVKSYVPIKMELSGISHNGESTNWKPELIATDPVDLGVVDAQTQARLTLTPEDLSNNFKRAPAVTEVIPTGGLDSSDSLLSAPVDFGVIRECDNATELATGKTVAVGALLEVGKRQVFSKAFDAIMVLNFQAEEL